MSQDGRIRRELGNSHTDIVRNLLNASHGAIGGAPGYNDTGVLTWGESVNQSYSYLWDITNSTLADELVREGLRAEGWYVREIGSYGFPLFNPTCTTGFWRSLVGIGL